MGVVLHPYIGADIELFATKEKRNKHNIIGATTIIKKGTSHDTNINTGGVTSIKEDGIPLEVTIEPSTCRDNVKTRLALVTRELDKLQRVNSFVASLQEIGQITPGIFKKIDNRDKELGCLPDINAYTGKINDVPKHYENIAIRTCGGHFHFGVSQLGIEFENNKQLTLSTSRDSFGTKEKDIEITFTSKKIDEWGDPKEYKRVFKKIKPFNIHELKFNVFQSLTPHQLYMIGWNGDYLMRRWKIEEENKKFKVKFNTDSNGVALALKNPLDTIKMIDLFCAIPAVLIDPGKSGRKRREIYGRAGSFRYTPYGFEYRVLSNFWFTDKALFSLYAGLARFGINLMGGYILKNTDDLGKAGLRAWEWINKENNIERIQYAINSNNFNTAKRIYDEIISPIMSEYGWNDEEHCPLTTTRQRIIFENICMQKRGYKDIFNNENFISNWTRTYSGWHSFIKPDFITHAELAGRVEHKWKTFKKKY